MPGVGGDTWDYGTTDWESISTDATLANSRYLTSAPFMEIAQEVADRADFIPLPNTDDIAYSYIDRRPNLSDLVGLPGEPPFARDVVKTTAIEMLLWMENLKSATNAKFWTGTYRGTIPAVPVAHSSSLESAAGTLVSWDNYITAMRGTLDGIRYRLDCVIGQGGDELSTYMADTLGDEDLYTGDWPVGAHNGWAGKGELHGWHGFPWRWMWSPFLYQACDPGPLYAYRYGAWFGICPTVSVTWTIVNPVHSSRVWTVNVNRVLTRTQEMPSAIDAYQAYPRDSNVVQRLVLVKKSMFGGQLVGQNAYWASENGGLVLAEVSDTTLDVDVDIQTIYDFAKDDAYQSVFTGREQVEFAFVIETEIIPQGDWLAGMPIEIPGFPGVNWRFAGHAYKSQCNMTVTESDRDPSEEGVKFTYEDTDANIQDDYSTGMSYG